MVVDSHVLLWWLEESALLSQRASEALSQAERSGSIFYVNAVSLWELRMKERRGLLRPTRPVVEWLRYLEPLPWLRVEATSAPIWLRAAGLDWSHRDPADRVIAATALHFETPVLTKDNIFHRPESPVEAVW